MRRIGGLLVAVLVLGSTAVRGAHAQHSLISLPLGDPAYLQLDALEYGGCRLARISPHRPYLIGWIRLAMDSARSDPRCEGPLLDALRERFVEPAADTAPERTVRFGATVTASATALQTGEFRPLWRPVRPPDEGTPPVMGAAAGRLTWIGGRSLVAVVEGWGQSHRRNDPRVRGSQFRRTSGVVDVSEAYVAGMAGPVMLSFGRSDEAWLGRGRESLVLSAHGPPTDRLAASLRWRSVEARALFASLDAVDLDPEGDSLAIGEPLRIYRYLAGHALTWRARRWLELTLGETILLNRRGPAPDLAYANPLMPYIITESDSARAEEGNDNNLVLFGSARLWLGRTLLSGELHIDDVQIDAQDRETVPDQLAWRIEAATALPGVWPVQVRASYTRVDGYTYLRGAYSSVYQSYGVPLGSELGPDADRGSLALDVWPRPWMRMGIDAGRWRRGAQRIDDRPSESMVGHAGEPYPTRTAERPVVQGAWTAAGRLDLLGATFPISVGVEAARLDNANNQPNSSTLHLRAHLVATYRFRYP